MSQCAFCSIVSGTSPARIVRETDTVICFLPKRLSTYGHSLIAPKAHYEGLFDIPTEVLAEVIEMARRLAESYKAAIDSTGVNLLHASGKAAQQSVPHFHFHLLPRFSDDGLNTWPDLPDVEVDLDELLRTLTGRQLSPPASRPRGRSVGQETEGG